ncbi:MAG: hypothetical protein L6R35_006255 [Caloplaca aegaea]|nr:MAG: hypothetical protein L6R35_006255 [Caloplaca aegaea]
MTVAVRGAVELFKLGGREKEIDGNLLTVIDESKTTKIYRHAIHTYEITALDGKDRWTTYNFVVAVYHNALSLLKHIRSVIDNLPEQVIKDLHASGTHLSETSVDNVDRMDGQLPVVD